MARYLSPRQMALLSSEDQMKADSLGRRFQSEWDPIYREHGIAAPPRMDGVDPRLYERQLALGITSWAHRLIATTDYD
jgi:hypothetical protein